MIIAAFLVAIAGGFAWLSWGPLRNIFADYQDSSSATYLLFGLPFLAVSVACLAAAVYTLRRR